MMEHLTSDPLVLAHSANSNNKGVDTASTHTRESTMLSPSCTSAYRAMFSLCISSLAIDEEARFAAATPSLQRLAYVRQELDSDGAAAAVVVIQECPELVSAFDRSGGPAAAAAATNLAASTRSLRGSLAVTSTPHRTPSPRASRRSHFFIPQVVRRLHPRTPSVAAAETYLRHTKVRWISEDVLVCFSRHENRRWSGLTVVAVDAAGVGGSDHEATWSSPPTSEPLADGTGWSTHVTPAMVQRFVMSGTKQGLVSSTPEERMGVLTWSELPDSEDARLSSVTTPRPDESPEEEEDIILNNIFNMEEDVVRGGVWVQLDSVLASIRFVHVGRGVFRYEVCQRVPLNNNFLNAEKGYLCPRWATAQRLVFVLDDEYQEIKAWNIHSVPAICLMNIPISGGASSSKGDNTNSSDAAPTGSDHQSPSSQRVERIFCSEDGGMLFLVSACGIRVVSTHQLRDVLAPSHNSTSRKFRSGVSDCARVFCGDELQDEQSTYVAWDTLGRATSSKKQRLFRTDRPHSLHGLCPTDVRRIAVVEDNISLVCHSGETLLLSPHGTVMDHQNIFIEPSTQVKSGLALHVGRPPLPSHVVELVVYRQDTTPTPTTTAASSNSSSGGCRAWFATASIDRDSLLRNEIRFDVSAIAIRLCELNDWDSTHVQDTTLRIALQESPEQVYTSIEEVFLRETVVGGAVGASTALVYSPGKARVTAMSADVTIRPISSLQLLCRLVRVVCSKFDHCPDDIQARSTLRVLMSTTIRVATLLLHHRACAHQLLPTDANVPSAARYLAALQKVGVAVHNISNITPPTASMFTDANAPASVTDASCSLSDDDLIVTNDVYFLSCVIHGLRVGMEHVPEGTPIVTTSSALPWCTRVCDAGILPAAVAALPGAAAKALIAAENKKASPVKQQPNVVVLQQSNQRSGKTAAALASSTAAASERTSPTTWAAFGAHVCSLLQEKGRGVAAICLHLRDMTHDLPPSLLETIASVIIREPPPSKSASPHTMVPPTTPSAAVATDLDVGGYLVGTHNVWQLAHLQRVVGFLVMERVVLAASLAATASPSHVVEECNELLSKVYGRARAAQWWALLYHKTSKDSVRDFSVVALQALHASLINEQSEANESKLFFDTLEQTMSTMPDAVRPSATEGTLSRVVHSRLLFSHGAFVADGKGVSSSVMPHNTSFLLLHEEDDDEPLDSQDNNDQYLKRVQDLAARAGQAAPQSHSAATRNRPQQVVSGPKDVLDVHPPAPPSTSAGFSSVAGQKHRPTVPLYDPMLGGDAIVLGSLAMLKPTQPLPYTDFALEWVHWSTFDDGALNAVRTRDGSRPSLFVGPTSPWDTVALEQLLFLRRDAQVPEDSLRSVLLGQLTSPSGTDVRYDRMFSLINYCFRHYDIEAFTWICRALFQSNDETANNNIEGDYEHIRGVILSTLSVTELELRATPESASLLHMQAGWCKCALHILGRTAISSSLTLFVGGGGEQLLDDTLHPWGPLLQLLLTTNGDADVRQAVVGHLLGRLSPSVPSATVRLCSTLLQSSPEAWRCCRLQEAVLSDEHTTIPAPQAEALLHFLALQSVFGGCEDADESSSSTPAGETERSDNEFAFFGQWLASTSAALLPLAVEGCPAAEILANPSPHERFLAAMRHALETTQQAIPVHPLLPWMLTLLESTGDAAAAERDSVSLAKAVAKRSGDSGAEFISNLTTLSASTETSTAPVDVTGAPGYSASLRDLLVGSACGLGSALTNEFWTFRLRTNRDDSSEVVFRRADAAGSNGGVATTSASLSAATIASFVQSGTAPTNIKSSGESVKALVQQMHQWSAVPPLVKVSESSDDVVVDMWALLLDGRPLSAHHVWAASKPTSLEERFMISAARAIAFQQHQRVELHVSIAAFLQLVDTSEFERFLMDYSVLARVAGLSVPGDDSLAPLKPSASMPALTAARYLTMLSPPSAFQGGTRSAEELSAIRALLDALEASNANTTAAAATASAGGVTTNIRGKLLAVHFVATYQGKPAALQYFFERIAPAHMASGDWASTLTIAWACGVSTEQWVTLPQSLASRATTPSLMYLAQSHASIADDANATNKKSICDARDWARRHSSLDTSAEGSTHLLEAITTGRATIAPADMRQEEAALTVAASCAAVLVANDSSASRAVAVMQYIASISHHLGVVNSAERAAASIAARRANASTTTNSLWESRDDEDVMQVLLAVMKVRDVPASCAVRTALKALWEDHQHAQDDHEALPSTTDTLTVLDVAEPMLLLHEALLSLTYGTALRVLSSLTEVLADCKLDGEVVTLFLLQLAQLHLLPNHGSSGGANGVDDGEDSGAEDAYDDDGEDEDAHLHPNLFNVLGVVLKALEQWRHPALCAPIVTWMRAALLVSDGDVPTASLRCKATAAAFLCCNEVLRLLMDVLGDPAKGTHMTAPQVMMACLNRHPKLAAECLQELSSTVDGLPSINSGAATVKASGPFVTAVRLVEDMVFHSGLFSCDAEHAQLLQVSLDAAVRAVSGSSASLAINALVHCLLSHTTTDETGIVLCTHVVNAALTSSLLAQHTQLGGGDGVLPPLTLENLSNCDAFLRAVTEHMPCEGTTVPKVIFRILLGTMAETEEAKQIATTFANAPLTRNSLLSQEVIAAVLPGARQRPSLRTWLRRHFATDVTAMLASPPVSDAAAPAPDDPIAFVEDYVSSDIIDEAKALQDRAEALHAAAQQLSNQDPAASATNSAARASLVQDQQVLLWKCTSSVLSRCMQDSGIQQLVPFLAMFPTNPLSTNHALASLQQLLHQCVYCILRSHYVPLMHDISQRLFSRDKKYPTALADFELCLREFFFVSAADVLPLSKSSTSAPQVSGQANFFGLGEASGWLCKERILAICSMLHQLQPLLDAARSLSKHAVASMDDGAPLSPGASQPLAGVTNLVSAFAEGIIAQCNRFQSFVKLPSRSHYPRLFLEPLVMMLVHGYWILQRHFDEDLASILTKELLCVMNVCGHDGDQEQMRRIVFAVGDISVLEYVVNCIPVSQLVTLANSSPDFQLQPLHRSTMRIAIMSFFDRLSLQEDFLSASRVEMTTLYANFRHFTALGDRLEHEAHHMLQGFIAQHSTQKKGILDSQKDALRRQNRMLDEIDTRFLSAANFFVQDSQFERCLACIRDLYLIQVQKKTSSIKVLGLEQDQAVQVMANQLDSAQDVIAVGYGYQITDHADWAAVLYRQVVHRGKRELFAAYRGQAVSLSPAVRRSLIEMWRADTAAHKESSKKQMWQWLDDEMQRNNGQ